MKFTEVLNVVASVYLGFRTVASHRSRGQLETEKIVSIARWH